MAAEGQLYRLALAAALAFAALILPVEAQVPQVVQTCGVGVSVPLGSGGKLYTDQSGILCVSGGGGSGAAGSIGSAGANGTQAQSVQGIQGGVPQNAFPCQYNATLPTLTTGQSTYASCDASGRTLVVLPATTTTLGGTFIRGDGRWRA